MVEEEKWLTTCCQTAAVARDDLCPARSNQQLIMNKFIHGLIFVFFGIVCWFEWAVLTLTSHVIRGGPLPGFSRLCVELKPVFVVLPVLALAYCLFVWSRKTEPRNSWIGFFAVTMAVT
jgi:hypothetical protein